jgi:hypothetical protein
VAQEREGITTCAPAKQTVRSQGAPSPSRLAALYPCQSPSGPQHLLAFGDAQTPRSAFAISLTRAELTRVEEVDLDGDGAQEWTLELAAAGAEVERRDVWIVSADATRVVFRTLGYSDETSASVRSGWAARAGTGLWAASLTAGRTRCVQLTWADGALHEASADAAFCSCAAKQLKAKARRADDSVDLRDCPVTIAR